jgi:hypothetical protein
MYDCKVKEDKGLDASEWFDVKKTMKGANPFINLPWFEKKTQSGAGTTVVNVSQSNACFSYMGRELGLWGRNDTEVIMCETLLSELMDLRNNMTNYAYRCGDANSEGLALVEATKGKNGILQKIEQHLANEKAQQHHTNELWLVGGHATTPDFHLWELLDQYLTLNTYVQAPTGLLDAFPRLQEFYDFFRNHRKNQYYLNSNLHKLPFNNKSAKFASMPGGGVFQYGMKYDWESGWDGIYHNTV